MRIRSAFILYLIFFSARCIAQTPPLQPCGQKEFTEYLFRKDASLRFVQKEIEKKLLERKKNSSPFVLGSQAPMVLSVVVHILHENGPENISDLQVQTAIQHLNEAFANTGFYDPADGAATPIQFCLAQRDPANQPTNGITRDVSPYTVMNPTDFYSDDSHVKDVNRWDPLCYINIWIVKTITPGGGVGGYANYPFSHGSPSDGIVIQAPSFGLSYPGDVVVIHEMGHYLGLYHTFEGGCTNTDCSVDGDRICDTPPDQSTAGIYCGQTANSCSTDVLSGLSTDQNDLTADYMDYGNFNCMKVFTQEQSDRMVNVVQTIRSSLLYCKACMPPCPFPVTAAFTIPTGTLEAGTDYTFINHSVNGNSFEWYVNGELVSTATDFNFHFDTVGSYGIRLVVRTNNDLCLDAEKSVFLYATCPGGCPVPPPSGPDSCAVNTFQKLIGSAKNDLTLDLDVDQQGNTYLFGHTGGGGGGEDMLMVKLDRAGKILRAKATGDASSNYGYSGMITSDGGTIQLGTSLGGQHRASLYKLDNAGNLQWSRNYSSPGIDMNVLRVIQTSDGGYLFITLLVANVGYPKSPMILTKTDGNGNVLWCKEYYTNFNAQGGIMTEDGNFYVMAGNLWPTGSLLPSLFVLSVDKATGSLNWNRTYQVDNSMNLRTERILKTGNRYLLSLSYSTIGAGGATNYHDGFVYVDAQGDFSEGYVLDNTLPLGEGNSINAYTDLAILKDGNICFYYGENRIADSMDAHLAKMTPDGKLLAAKRYVLPYQQFLEHIRPTPDGGVIGTGYAVENSSFHVYLLKTDSALRLTDPSHEAAGCAVIDESPPIHQPVATETMLSAANTNLIMNVTDNYPVVADIAMTATDYCSNPALCNSIKISGSDSVCVSDKDTLVFKALRATGCTLPVQWQADPARVKIISSTDNTVRLLCLKPGPVMLYATLTIRCKIIRDSMLFHGIQTPGLDLGEDLALCKQSTVRLNAGSGFKSYHWQDGSVDSGYTAWLPGKYYVRATDYCDRAYSDTILILQAPDLSFDLGPDTVLCRTDTVVITAPEGFSSYSWSPLYHAGNPYSQIVKLYPDKDTTYTCTAIKGRGCIVTDTIHVKVNPLPEHFLAPVPGICDGAFVTLSVIGEWQGYKWFDRSEGTSVRVNFPGNYSLEVTDTNGCVGKESVTVLPAACHPGVYFPNAFSPDQNGRNDVYKALVSVPLDKFYMAIYNRKGERVFETRDPNLGWDGRFNGNAQPTNTFLWYANFHVQGSFEKESTMKGTLILVR